MGLTPGLEACDRKVQDHWRVQMYSHLTGGSSRGRSRLITGCGCTATWPSANSTADVYAGPVALGHTVVVPDVDRAARSGRAGNHPTRKERKERVILADAERAVSDCLVEPRQRGSVLPLLGAAGVCMSRCVAANSHPVRGTGRSSRPRGLGTADRLVGRIFRALRTLNRNRGELIPGGSMEEFES